MGLRVGYSIPFGDAYSSPLSDLVTGTIPLWFDLGYRITPSIYVGGEFSYASAIIPLTSSTCPTDPAVQCTGHQFRFGVDGIYHFRPEATLDPWAGLGVGYEILNITATDTDMGVDVASASLHGLVFAHLQGGLDLRANRFIDFGPFLDVSLGQYASTDVFDAQGNVVGQTPTALHGWFTLGLRATLNP